jgi:signal transduction histidine kinase/ligand-binding sensor domain-containing protein
MKLIFTILLIIATLLAHASNVRGVFIPFTNENQKLTNNIVEAVVRDALGYVWVGTNNGLNRLDGYTTHNYVNDPSDPHSLSSNFIRTLFIDSDGDLWIGTIGGGLNFYDRANDRFVRYQPQANSPNSISGNNVAAIVEDQDGALWIGTTGDGINRFDKKTKMFTRFRLDPTDPFNTNIRSMMCDFENNIWVGFDYESNGVYRIGARTGKISFLKPDQQVGKASGLGPVRGIVQHKNGRIFVATWGGRIFEVEQEPSNKMRLVRDKAYFNNAAITDFITDREGNFWVGSWEHGLLCLDENLTIRKKFVKERTKQESIVSNSINKLIVDSHNALWIAHRNNGVSMLSLDIPLFQKLDAVLDGKPFIDDLDAQAFQKDRNGNIWIATRGQGLWRYNPQNETFKQFIVDKKNGLTTNYLMSIHICAHGQIWVGTDGQFITRFDPLTERFTQIDYSWGDWSAVFSITCDTEYLWCGTWGSGVKRVNKKTLEVQSIDFDAEDQYRNSVFDVVLLDSTLWIANIGLGLFKMNRNATKPELVFSTNEPKGIFPNSRINDLDTEGDSILWISTAGAGAIRYNVKTKKLEALNERNELSNNIVQAVVHDRYNQYWFSTISGVTVLNRNFKQPINFYIHNGLPSNAINKSAAFYDSEADRIYLGTQLGVSFFNPSNVEVDSFANRVIFTGFSVMGQAIDKLPNPHADAPISIANSITLNPGDKMLTIYFSAMDFSPSFLNSYEYKLVGFDENWRKTTYSKNFAQYTNLNPGTYFFKVKTSNRDGVASNEESVLKVVVKPAVYQTWLFKLGVLLLLVLCVLLIFKWRMKSLKRAKHKLEAKVAERTLEIEQQKAYIEKQNKLLEENNASKDRFFSIIGHDLNNPMSSIDQLLELLEMEYDTMPSETVSIMIKHLRKSSAHTLELLHNLMTWAQTQTNRIKIDKQVHAVSQLFETTQTVCEMQAQQKNIHLSFQTKPLHVGFFDMNTISTVLRNLVTNAIKFSKPNDTVLISSKIEEGKLVICVKDHGSGIPNSELKDLFKIEKMKSKKGTQGETGTGLGLILCHEFVLLNGGKIWVKSTIGQGTTFYFSIENKSKSENDKAAAN